MRNPEIRNNRTACFVSSLVAVIATILIGILGMFILTLAGRISHWLPENRGFLDQAIDTENAWLIGIWGCFVGMTLAMFLVFVSVPVVLLLWGLTVGRLVHRGTRQSSVYIRTGVVLGAIATALVCVLLISVWLELMLFTRDDVFIVRESILIPVIPLTISAGLTGVFSGGLAGAVAAFTHLLILRPHQQIANQNFNTADVFD